MAEPGFTALRRQDGTPSPDALLEQAAGLVGVYAGSRELILKLLGFCGGGTLVALLVNPRASLPSLALLSQGRNYYLWIAGTVNVRQWVGNVTGSMWRTELPGGQFVHGYYYSLATELWQLGQQYLPPPGPGLNITVVGHSLGGGVAQVLGLYLLGIYEARQIELITFGQPKAYAADAEAANRFALYWRFRMLGDPVPQLPMDQGQSFWGALASVTPLASRLVAWRHYGKGWLVGSDGSIVSDPGLSEIQTAPFDWLGDISIQQHLIQHYVWALETALGVR